MLGSAYALLRIPKVQTYLALKVAAYLSKELGSRVYVGGVDIEFFNKVILEDVYIEDRQKKPILVSEELKLTVNKIDIEKNKLHFNKLSLTKTKFYLSKTKDTRDLNIQFLIDYFSPKDKSGKTENPEVHLNAIDLTQCTFFYRDYKDSVGNYGVDYSNIYLQQVNASLADINILDDTIACKIKQLSFTDHSGFSVNDLSTTFRISPVGLNLNNFILKTDESTLNADIHFKTQSYRDYNNFIEAVNFNSQFNNSRISGFDLSFFAPELEGLKQNVLFSGAVRGTINDLSGKNIKIQYGTQTTFAGNISLTGLPEINETFIHLKVYNLETIKRDIELLQAPPFTSGATLKLPTNVASLGKIKFKGDFTGFLNDFVAYGDFKTALGNFSSDISLAKDTSTGVTRYKGNLKTYDFNAGVFAGVTDLGKITMDVKVDGKGLTQDKLNLILDGNISSLMYRNYKYSNIIANGNFLKNVFKGTVGIEDANVSLNFDGNVDFSGDLPFLDFTASVRKLNLSALNFYKPGKDVNLATTVVFKITGNNIDNITGNIAALNTEYSEEGKILRIESIDLIASEQKENKTLQLFSSVADARVEGRFNSDELDNSFKYLVSEYLPSLNKGQRQVKIKDQDFSFSLETKDTYLFTELFLPQLSFEKTLKLNGDYSSSTNSFKLNLNTQSIKVYGKELYDLSLQSQANRDQIELTANCRELLLSDSVKVNNIKLSSVADNDTIDWKLLWDNESVLKNKGNVSSFISFSENPKIKFKILPSEVWIEDSLWLVSKSNEIVIDSSQVLFTNLLFTNNNQIIKLDGAISKDPHKELDVVFSNFNIANFNPLIKDNDVSMSGFVDGKASLSNIYSNLVFTSSLNLKNFVFNNEKLGDGSIVSLWDSKKESIGVNGKFYRGTIPTLAFTGFYHPNRNNDNLDFEIQLEKTQIKMLEQYAKGLISDLKGIASGELFLKGSFKNPVVDGTLQLQKVGFLVDYLNTRYTFSNEVILKENKIEFNGLNLFDSKGNKAIVKGKVNHKYFRDYRFDIYIDAQNLFCLNTNETQNSMYYGDAFATGKIQIYGDVKNIAIDISARTEKGTIFNIPLENAMEVKENKFIRFVNKDTTKLAVKQKYHVDLSGVQLYFDLEVTPDAEVQIIFDSKAGDIIKSNGSGNLKMEINTLGNFEMFGTYTINSGDYLFTLENVINKRFKVEQGGTINWNGDPYNANLNLSAIYKVRTNLFDLLQDTTREEFRRRIPIDVKLIMTEKLLNPNIKFAIELPKNVDERTVNEVKSIINPEDEQEVNRQVFALLILNRFMPDPNKSNYAGEQLNSGVNANASELLSNQLSNWLSSAVKDVDLGVKYKAGNDVNRDEVELALATQLFNERISIDGNVGVANNQSASNIVGDVNVEYKVSKDGKLRVKAFHESNDYNVISNNAPYTQGVGLFFREEFENFSDLFKKYKQKIFRKKEENKPVQ